MVRWYLTREKKKNLVTTKATHECKQKERGREGERERERDQTFEHVLVNSLQNIFLFSCSFPLSTSACYWDPEVTLRVKGSLYLTCTVSGEDYNAFTDRGDLCPLSLSLSLSLSVFVFVFVFVGVVAHAMHDRLLHPSS